jgi:rhomboid family GlyGly-CTERM serine protease
MNKKLIRFWQRLRGVAADVPWTLCLSAAAILAAASPAATDMLELDRTAASGGEVWRVFTCHVTHFGMDHLLWDVAMFVALGSVCELRWPRATRFVLLTSAVAIGWAVLCFSDVATYRGLSGIDSALFGLVATSLLLDNDFRRGPLFAAGLWMLLVGFVAKVGYELWVGSTVFVDSQAAGFVPVPLAHAIGFCVGTVGGAFAGRRPHPVMVDSAFAGRRPRQPRWSGPSPWANRAGTPVQEVPVGKHGNRRPRRSRRTEGATAKKE